MHTVESCFVARSNSVRKMRPLATMGDERPDPTAVFQRTFLPGPNSTGGLPSPSPEEFGPRNAGHASFASSAAPAKVEKAAITRQTIQVARVMAITPFTDSVQARLYRFRATIPTELQSQPM